MILTWVAGCVNPEGDLYYGCYQKLANSLSAAGVAYAFTTPEACLSPAVCYHCYRSLEGTKLGRRIAARERDQTLGDQES